MMSGFHKAFPLIRRIDIRGSQKPLGSAVSLRDTSRTLDHRGVVKGIYPGLDNRVALDERQF